MAELEIADTDPALVNVLDPLPARQKSALLLCFCLAVFMDVAGTSAAFIMTAPIAADLGLDIGNSIWVVYAYSIPFAALLLFAGRVSDLYSPSLVFTAGFLGCGILNLVISFMNNKYAFLVLRAASAVFAVFTLPSSVNMIVQMYQNRKEQAGALVYYSLAGALANTVAFVIAGGFLVASWRWYFRFVAMIIIPLSGLSFWMLPCVQPVVRSMRGVDKWKRMDVLGADLLLALLVLFMLAWTQVEGQGWRHPLFIAPLVISLVLLPLFLLWEDRLPVGFSLLPHGLWHLPNIAPLVLSGLTLFLWYAPYQLRMATYFQVVLRDSAIITGVKILPMGITACLVGGVAQQATVLLQKPRYSVPIASALCFGSGILLAFSGGGHGKDYWRYIFPSQVIGTTGAMTIYVVMNTNLIQTFPQGFAGVAGSFVQVLFQVGAAIGNAAQAGFLGSHTNPAEQSVALADWKRSRDSFFFTSAVIAASGIAFAVLFRHDRMSNVVATNENAAAEAQREAARDAEARQSSDVPIIN
ncbi:MFS general substrate transporter [Cutaneotrichosporon oleaginosum]|uniref:MFS general substrate transporter n=1 Tax=Cutaneotrichosporon oleaginosum TaxID=879819 RepID=A0A0J1AUE9_9TREE|nr:MFS general substrate transporter [Cutaneotrichosporon oleaginosum]KLT38894.1 MFS general substrate transporter [Cutaneotrichosporon oleaginosum]TXT10375.1 hypothetical protein COLE_04309 [Cutaneotrichosporon oleaginosum]